MSTDRIEARPSAASSFVIAVAMAFAGMVLIQPFAVWLLAFAPAGAGRPATGWTLAAAAVGVAAALGARVAGRGTLVLPLATGIAGVALLGATSAGGWIPGLALLPLAVALGFAAPALQRRLPGELDRFVARRRLLATLWAVACLLSVAQTSRLATFAGDTSRGFVVGTDNPFWYGHLCLPAYLHAAELALAGESNLYDASHWPALDPRAEPATRFEGMRIEDPYQYPPPFLLLPALAITLTARWDLVLAAWFTLHVALFVTAYVALARRVGGRSGTTALWLLPIVALAFPVVYNFQFGQFHLAAASLAVLGLLAFERGRAIAGGALLAIAVLAKVFPAVLLGYLAGRRRWRELGAFVAACALFTGLALAVFGTTPFTAFLDYQLPRLGDGSAFAFDEAWPEVSELVIADNQGVFGLARKFGASKPASALAGRIFALLLFGAAFWAGFARREHNELDTAWIWLALLGLGSMASPGAWGDYVPSLAIWLLAFVAARGARSARLALALGLAGLFQYFLLGTFPWGPPTWMIPISAVGVFGLLGLYVGALVAANRPSRGAGAERSLAGLRPPA